MLASPPPSERGPFLAFLAATALVCGALVMVIEVMGSRVIGPFFGVSLFVWTSLITVTLVALSAGYALGGLLSDRRGTPDVLYGVILAAGLATLLVPFLRAPLLQASAPLGLRAGALVCSGLLFGPSLFLLGCVTPLLVKIAAREMASIGRTVGTLYAISTLGSFLGTVLTGFVFIAWFGVARIFQVVGALLVVLACVWFVAFRRRWAVALLLLLTLPSPAPGPRAKVFGSGERISEVARRDGFYGSLRVVDHQQGDDHWRELVIDGLVQGGMDLGSRLSVYDYAYFLQYLPWSMNPGGRTCLVVGLGAGLVPAWYERMGVRTDVVDIDPGVIELARRYFGLAVSGEVVADDARHFLAVTGRSWDYVILDAFNGDGFAGHLVSREALQLLSRRLAPRGILAINLIGSVGAEGSLTASVVRTLRQVFPRVEVHPVFDPAHWTGLGNFTVLAWSDPSLRPDPARVADFPFHHRAEGAAELLFRTWEFPPGTPAMVLTDDHNPVDLLDRRLREDLREHVLAATDWDIAL